MRRSPLLALSLVVFIDMLGFSIIIPVLPYYGEAYGASPTIVGLLFASYSFMQFLISPLWGGISDRIGRKPVLVAGLIGAAVGFVIFGLARSLMLLFVSRIVAGTMAATVPVAMAAVSDVTTPMDRARGMGALGAAMGLGFVIGPAVGGFLEHLGHGAPAFVAAALAVLNAVWVAFALPESLRPESRARAWLPVGALRLSLKPGIGLTLAVYFASLFALAAMEATFALLVEDRFYPGLGRAHLARRVGMFFGFVGIIIVIVQGGLLGRLAKWIGEGPLVPIGLALSAIGLALLPFAGGIGGILCVLAVLSVGSALIRPVASSILTQLVTGDLRGGMLSVNQSLASLARALGPAWGGWVYHRWGMEAPFVAGGAITVLALLGSLVLVAILPAEIRARRSVREEA